MINAFKYIRFDQLIAFYGSLVLVVGCLTLIPIEFDALQAHWLFLSFAILASKASPLSLSAFICIRRADVLHPNKMAKKLFQLILGQCLIHAVESFLFMGFLLFWQGVNESWFWALTFFCLSSASTVLLFLLKMLGPVFSRHVQILFIVGMMLPQIFLVLVPYESLLMGQYVYTQILPLLASVIFDVLVSFLVLFSASQWWSP